MARSAFDQELAHAFDGQAALFERAPVQSDAKALAQLVEFARLPEQSRILDVGCGPGLVAEAFLSAGHAVLGVDLSGEMIARAKRRCERFGARARWLCASLDDPAVRSLGPFDAAISRYVLHHVKNPDRFMRDQCALVRQGGVVVLLDHTTDAESDRRGWHQEVERMRDRTHTRNLIPAEIEDLFARAGLAEIELYEEAFTLDFNEWFDRGTPAVEKLAARHQLLDGPKARGFAATREPDGSIRIECQRTYARGILPDSSRGDAAEISGADRDEVLG